MNNLDTIQEPDIYKTFSFNEVKVGELNKWQLERISQSKHSNGLFNAITTAYSSHIPLEISPDHILNCVAGVWSKYIVLHAEKFRDQFVSHEGKLTLEHKSEGSFDETRVPEMMRGIANLLRINNKQSTAWIDAEFETTTDLDTLVRLSALLTSQKEYYEYKMAFCCGLPKVTLLGQQNDWDALTLAISNMPTLDDDKLKTWQDGLSGIIEMMIDGEESFWQTCATSTPYGSGGQKNYHGWANIFNPILENGEWIGSQLDDDDILNLQCEFPIAVNDNGNEFLLNISAGQDRVEFVDGTLRASSHFDAVKE